MKMDLIEMTTLRKKDSGLPVNLFIDDSISYKRQRYPKGVVFQNNESSFVLMILDGKVVEKTLPVKLEITSKDIEQVRNFVLNNAECLSLVADFDLDYDYFKYHLMIPGGELATKEQRLAQKELLDEYLNGAP